MVAYATSGVAPKDIFIAPVLAVRQVLEKAGLVLKDIDLFELNEAFAAQMLACGKELSLDEATRQRQRRGDCDGASDRGLGNARAGDTAARAGAARLAARPGVAVPGRRQCGGDACGALSMASRPKMPVPTDGVAPQALCRSIREWAEQRGFRFEQLAHAAEFAKIRVYDPADGSTTTVVPNAHRGRRLRKDQARYTVQFLNTHWKD